jgi:lipopolysaccharide export system permease protein
MLLLFIPIGILVDLSEKIDKLKEFDVPFNEIVDYYLNFVWYSEILFIQFLFF